MDENLILRDSVRESVSLRLADKAISVREEVIKLVGSYVIRLILLFTTPVYLHIITPFMFIFRGFKNISIDYLNDLMLRLNDEGISVRKSAVNILRDILSHQPSHPEYISICIALLRKLADVREEDSVKDLIRTTFQNVWFTPPSPSIIRQFVTVLKNDGETGYQVIKRNGDAKEGALSNLLSLEKGVIPLMLQSLRTNSDQKERHDILNDLTRIEKDGFFGGDTSNDVSSKLRFLPEGWKAISPIDFGAMKNLAVEYDADFFNVASSTSPNQLNQRNVDGEGIENAGECCAAFMSNEGDIFRSFESALESCGFPSDPKLYAHHIRAMLTDYERNIPPLMTEQVQDSEQCLSLHINFTSSQLVEIASIPAAIEWMVLLLREVLHGMAEGEEAAEQVKARRLVSLLHCEKLLASLQELLLKTEENAEEIMALLAEKKKSKGRHVAGIIVAIAFFCEAHPPFASKVARTLLPYLKGDSNLEADQNALISFKITEIVAAASTSVGEGISSINFDEVVPNLIFIALNYGSKNVSAAIQCLSQIISNITHDASPLFSLAEKCFFAMKDIARVVYAETQLAAQPSHLVSTPSTPHSLPNKALADKLQRCLIVLGYICENIRKCSTAFRTFGDSFPVDVDSLVAELPQVLTHNDFPYKVKYCFCLCPPISEFQFHTCEGVS